MNDKTVEIVLCIHCSQVSLDDGFVDGGFDGNREFATSDEAHVDLEKAGISATLMATCLRGSSSFAREIERDDSCPFELFDCCIFASLFLRICYVSIVGREATGTRDVRA